MQIEEGKFYRARNGEAIGPMERVETDRIFPFRGRSTTGPFLTYTAAGRWQADGEESRRDLVSELHANTPAPGVYTEDQVTPQVNDPYQPLRNVLDDAHAQASSGKGKQRHNGRGVAFDRQPILEIGRMCGLGYPTGQAQKKTQEAVSMFNRGEHDRAEAELLGAINYLAAAVLLIREQR